MTFCHGVGGEQQPNCAPSVRVSGSAVAPPQPASGRNTCRSSSSLLPSWPPNTTMHCDSDNGMAHAAWPDRGDGTSPVDTTDVHCHVAGSTSLLYLAAVGRARHAIPNQEHSDSQRCPSYSRTHAVGAMHTTHSHSLLYVTQSHSVSHSTLEGMGWCERRNIEFVARAYLKKGSATTHPMHCSITATLLTPHKA